MAANCQLARSAELSSHGVSGCSKRSASVSPRQRRLHPVPGGAEESAGVRVGVIIAASGNKVG